MEDSFKYVFVSQENIQDKAKKYGKAYQNSLLEGNLAHIIAHEITHADIQDYMGILAKRNFPRWKDEGYCEYISTIKSIQQNQKEKIIDRINRIE